MNVIILFLPLHWFVRSLPIHICFWWLSFMWQHDCCLIQPPFVVAICYPVFFFFFFFLMFFLFCTFFFFFFFNWCEDAILELNAWNHVSLGAMGFNSFPSNYARLYTFIPYYTIDMSITMINVSSTLVMEYKEYSIYQDLCFCLR